MKSCVGSIADGAPFKFLPVHQYKGGKGSSKITESKCKKDDGRANSSFKSTETWNKLSTTLYLQSKINLL